MTLEIYKPRTERNSKQPNKTLVETVGWLSAPSRNNALANKTQHNTFLQKKKYLNLVLSLPVFVSLVPSSKGLVLCGAAVPYPRLMEPNHKRNPSALATEHLFAGDSCTA
jgi:hypothetical protein